MRIVEGNKEKEKMTEKIKYIKGKKGFEKGVLLIIFFYLKLHIFVANRFLANCFLNTQMRKCHCGNCLCNEGVLAKSLLFFFFLFCNFFHLFLQEREISILEILYYQNESYREKKI